MRGAPDRSPPAVNRAAITISIMLRDDHAGDRYDDRQCCAAAHSGQPVRGAGPDHLDPDLLYRCRRDYDPADRLARWRLWHQGRLSDLGRRLYRGLGAVRLGAEPSPDGALSLAARDMRCRIDAVVASGAAAHQPARAAWPSDGDLGHRSHDRADCRPCARRLADRQLQLALGVLHQPAGRDHCLPRHPCFHSREPSRPPRSLRFFRLCGTRRRDRRAADAARPRASSRIGSTRPRSGSRRRSPASPFICLSFIR